MLVVFDPVGLGQVAGITKVKEKDTKDGEVQGQENSHWNANFAMSPKLGP